MTLEYVDDPKQAGTFLACEEVKSHEGLCVEARVNEVVLRASKTADAPLPEGSRRREPQEHSLEMPDVVGILQAVDGAYERMASLVRMVRM